MKSDVKTRILLNQEVTHARAHTRTVWAHSTLFLKVFIHRQHTHFTQLQYFLDVYYNYFLLLSNYIIVWEFIPKVIKLSITIQVQGFYILSPQVTAIRINSADVISFRVTTPAGGVGLPEEQDPRLWVFRSSLSRLQSSSLTGSCRSWFNCWS